MTKAFFAVVSLLILLILQPSCSSTHETRESSIGASHVSVTEEPTWDSSEIGMVVGSRKTYGTISATAEDQLSAIIEHSVNNHSKSADLTCRTIQSEKGTYLLMFWSKELAVLVDPTLRVLEVESDDAEALLTELGR